jgi:hypothetical protein
MRIRVKRRHCGLVAFVLAAALPAQGDGSRGQGHPVDPPTFFLPEPCILEVATLGDEELHLRAALWRNSCLGDVSRDGRTNVIDLAALLGQLPDGEGSPFAPDADLNKDGCVDLADLAIVIGDYGCDCRQNSMPPPLHD